MQPTQLLNNYLDSLRKVYPAYANRASQAGHPCERALVYQRTAWREALPPDRRLQGIFLFGSEYEQLLRRILLQAGYLLRQPSRPIPWLKFKLSGTDDGDISWDHGKTWHMVEIKGLHQYYFDRVESWRSFLELGPIYAKYPAQIHLYMLLNSVEHAYFVLGRKGSFELKFLLVEFDYEYAESILQKLERINRHVAAGTLPAQINDVDCCEICEYRLYCAPDLPYGEGSWVTHEREAIELLEEHERLGALRSELCRSYDNAHERVKTMMGESPLALIGTYQIRQKADRNGILRMRIKNLAGPSEPEEQPADPRAA